MTLKFELPKYGEAVVPLSLLLGYVHRNEQCRVRFLVHCSVEFRIVLDTDAKDDNLRMPTLISVCPTVGQPDINKISGGQRWVSGVFGEQSEYRADIAVTFLKCDMFSTSFSVVVSHGIAKTGTIEIDVL